jgi:predicted transcriptional regulator of viral defense system
MEASMISRKLLLEGKKIATRDEIFEIARKIGKDEKRSLNYLLEEGYIVRILRGFFYVRGIEERSRKTQDLSIYQLVARALERKGVKKWYFAFETALKLNLMTHEYFLTNYVITDSYRTTKVIRVIGQDFLFIKRAKQHFDHGLVNKDEIWYSDRIKTVIDLAYRDYLKKSSFDEIKDILHENQRFIDKDQMIDYLKDYPGKFKETVESMI